jgi:hypothetical protein
MKNIHLIPTDKPSRLTIRLKTNELMYSYKEFVNQKCEDVSLNQNQNIYITSDEEIKEGDWCLSKLNKAVRFGKNFTTWLYKKIILTTDPDLIAEGVQSIDDEFLEWFVKNPSCERVEVTYGVLKPFQSENKGYLIHCPDNEVLEEPKQIKCYCGHTITCDCGPLEEPKQEYELKDFESGGILDVLNMGNIEYLSNGDIIYNPNLFFVKRGDKWFIKTKKQKQETLEDFIRRESKSANESVGIVKGVIWQQETLDKKSLYIQDYKSRISALQYVIDFYEILTKEDIVKQKDDYSKQLKDLENE